MSYQPADGGQHHHQHHHHRGAAALDIDPISPSFMKRVKHALRIPLCFRGQHFPDEQDGSHSDTDTSQGGFNGVVTSATSARARNHRHGFSGELSTDGGHKGGKPRAGRHRRGYSMGDFQYDATSYKLNFEEPGDDAGVESIDDLRYRSFSTRFSVAGSPRKALHDFSYHPCP